MTTTIQTAAPVSLTCVATQTARHLGQPLLLVGVAGAIAVTLSSGVPLGLAALGILFGTIACLFALERLIPFREDWQPSASEWRRDSIYFGLNGLVSTLVPAGVGVLAIYLARGTTGLSLAVEIPLGFALASFVGYWTHRLGHDVGALWQLHGVHHTPDKVNSWNNNVIHFADLIFQNASSLAALVLLGFSPEAVFAITAFNQAVGFVDHANADFRMGWLNYVIGSPEQHRLHHSTDLEEAGNYSTLPLWDIVFGTFTWRPNRVPTAIGIDCPETFPSPDSIVRNAVHPLKVWLHRAR